METTSYGNNPESTVQHTTEVAREEARRLAEDAKRSGEAIISDRKDSLAEQLGDLAHALRNSVNELEGRDRRTSTQLLSSLANGMEQVSRSLRESDLHSLRDRTRDYAHREPALFIGGAVAAGFMLSRFFKSSPPSRR